MRVHQILNPKITNHKWLPALLDLSRQELEETTEMRLRLWRLPDGLVHIQIRRPDVMRNGLWIVSKWFRIKCRKCKEAHVSGAARTSTKWSANILFGVRVSVIEVVGNDNARPYFILAGFRVGARKHSQRDDVHGQKQRSELHNIKDTKKAIRSVFHAPAQCDDVS